MKIDELIEFRKKLWSHLDGVAKAKGNDYSGADPDSDTFANIKLPERYQLPSEIGLMVRLGDKYSRTFNLLMMDWFKTLGVPNAGESKVKEESIDDTLLDSINYFSYVLAIRREKGRFNPKWLNE